MAIPLRLRVGPSLIAIAWVGFLVYLAYIPDTPYVPLAPAGATLPLAHYIAHLVLAALIYLAIEQVESHWRLGFAVLLLSIGLSAGLGLATEALQYFLPERGAQLSDLGYAALGAGTGATAIFVAERRGAGRRFLSTTAAGVTGLLFLMVVGSLITWDPSLPRVGDHWHASYQVEICGTALPPIPGTPGGVHTHGDGFIHIHPARESEAGANATLAAFFATSGLALTDTSVTNLLGKTYSNGDRCPDGRPGELVVTVNGVVEPEPSSYIMRDGDGIRIQFRPAR